MIAHYVLWVSLAIAAIVAVYGAYNYMLSMAVNFHADELENTFKLLAQTPIGETRQAVIAIPQGVKIAIYNRGQSDWPSQCSDAPACLVVSRLGRGATFTPLPRPVKVVGPQELHVGIYRVAAKYVTDPQRLKICLTINDILTPIEVNLHQTNDWQAIKDTLCNGTKPKQQVVNTISNMLPSEIAESVNRVLVNLCAGSTGLGNEMWATYCTGELVFEVNVYT